MTLSSRHPSQEPTSAASAAAQRDVYGRVKARTTLAGAGSTEPREIATRALKVLERLAASDTSDDASAASSWRSRSRADDGADYGAVGAAGEARGVPPEVRAGGGEDVDDADDAFEYEEFNDDYALEDDAFDAAASAAALGRKPRRANANANAAPRDSASRFRAPALGAGRAPVISFEDFLASEDAAAEHLEPGATETRGARPRRVKATARRRDEEPKPAAGGGRSSSRVSSPRSSAEGRPKKAASGGRRAGSGSGGGASSGGGGFRSAARRSKTAEIFLEAMSNAGGSEAAYELASSFADPKTRITVERPGGEGRSSSFTIGDLGFDDVPIDGENVEMFVEGGREYFEELYAKGAEWVNAEYSAASNTTSQWLEQYEESGRSKKYLTVDLFVDAADPYSLELVLGPVQHLLKMDLGPLVWNFKPHSNIGQAAGQAVQCGGDAVGQHAQAASCLANAVIACADASFNNATSGLGRWAAPARAAFARRIDRARERGRERERPTKSGSRGRRRLASVGASESSSAGDYDGFLADENGHSLLEADDTNAYDAEAIGGDVDSFDWPRPSFLEEVASAPSTRAAEDVAAPENVFVKCFATKLLQLESTSAFGFNDGGGSKSISDLSAECCEVAMANAPPAFGGGGVGGGGGAGSAAAAAARRARACSAQKECVAGGAGFDALRRHSRELASLRPKHKWLPWVLVEGKPVCMHSCNLQKGIRRAVCNSRDGTLPKDCPRFPWGKIWYDEPGVSLAGVLGVVIGLVLTTGSMVLLAQQAGLCGRGRADDALEGDEREPLLG